MALQSFTQATPFPNAQKKIAFPYEGVLLVLLLAKRNNRVSHDQRSRREDRICTLEPCPRNVRKNTSFSTHSQRSFLSALFSSCSLRTICMLHSPAKMSLARRLPGPVSLGLALAPRQRVHSSRPAPLSAAPKHFQPDVCISPLEFPCLEVDPLHEHRADRAFGILIWRTFFFIQRWGIGSIFFLWLYIRKKSNAAL